MKNRIKYYLQTKVVPFIFQLFVKFIYLTSKKNFHHPLIDTKETFVISFWHGELLMQPFNYHKLKPNGIGKGLISEHKDGQAITKTVEYLGIGSIRGSSSNNGLKALLEAIKESKKGVDVAVTPDGPRGPRHSVADGIIAVAQKANCRVLALNCVPTSYWQFKSWDKFVIPKPFGTINFYISEPFSVKDMQMEEAKSLLKEKMLKNALI